VGEGAKGEATGGAVRCLPARQHTPRHKMEANSRRQYASATSPPPPNRKVGEGAACRQRSLQFGEGDDMLLSTPAWPAERPQRHCRTAARCRRMRSHERRTVQSTTRRPASFVRPGTTTWHICQDATPYVHDYIKHNIYVPSIRIRLQTIIMYIWHHRQAEQHATCHVCHATVPWHSRM